MHELRQPWTVRLNVSQAHDEGSIPFARSSISGPLIEGHFFGDSFDDSYGHQFTTLNAGAKAPQPSSWAAVAILTGKTGQPEKGNRQRQSEPPRQLQHETGRNS
ncbi:hypothetical protein [Pseudomonas aeruginosa]|uniref:hypothetical protein n=1 Tax=Pseudomonas aeruginosa TaxID=287 RepID=UPI000FF64682|nr:hypothetical protein [Pseudomonas aeruginosa]RWY05593.1 hypothetical protein EQH80_17440 [Pseudomonas aeruginosa]